MCLTPLTLVKDKTKVHELTFATNKVPCGKCPKCLQARASSWAFRIAQEQKRAASSAFVTLTYADEHLNKTSLVDTTTGEIIQHPTLYKKDVQDYHKRLRKRAEKITGTKSLIKYYLAGEYGTNTIRPHYHGIYFNLPDEMLKFPELIEMSWNKGQVHVGEVEPASIMYVCNYIQSKSDILKTYSDQGVNNDQLPWQPEFSLMSKGLGENYLSPAMRKYYATKLIPYIPIEDGKKLPMPRYYKTKLYDQEQLYYVKQNAKAYAAEAQEVDAWETIQSTKAAFKIAARKNNERNLL